MFVSLEKKTTHVFSRLYDQVEKQIEKLFSEDILLFSSGRRECPLGLWKLNEFHDAKVAQESESEQWNKTSCTSDFDIVTGLEGRRFGMILEEKFAVILNICH